MSPHPLMVRGLAAAGLLLCLAGAAPAGAQSISTLTARNADANVATAPAPAAPAAPQAAAATPAAPSTILVPVPAVTLYAGDVISEAVLTDRPVPIATLERGGIVGGRGALIGKAVRRTVLAGVPVPLNAVADVQVVTKGVATRVKLEEGGLVISGYAMPLESGAVGATVRLKNMESGQTILGTVQADGSVRVNIR
ncbi:flagellar basal body P-ring formation protein FlgA [Aquabacter sp. L1I39]|uniref:flagellar basal body P-ring formation chaperone FlgA n=1 Tax=Aquabacter sp. L1I39 TaxID=2820278 RepID=UPI001ADD27D5|nr:flagellar basal body P-ring formation chaperone FlgA [Aquabacter sp. L1I39]QTL04324.1 flagellar basal body P-ring formation protein FlgA [Aquabacter sp. L1I39]